ncbi:hypothetical protein NEHOM01_2170 [Nematocida homosporus]|uniref:uncharacterized protein n=1 Tax=Nematocida homosporus TaxID=1912981 RepID=UPI00221F5482|nr:uncharacterized protein NEHOM01_2170 [Nematocida homosporus]KAI5187428.1 hypothetical protein NEHOM01_2170 [Nematocida homosporus]
MPVNPFQARSVPDKSIESRLGQVLGSTLDQDYPKKVKTEESKIKTEVSLVTSEAEILKSLSVKREDKPKPDPIDRYSFFNLVKSNVTEDQKKGIETVLQDRVYYHVPETESIRREEGSSFAAIFTNWRKALSGIFSEYRAACIQNKKEFAFMAYVEEALCFFHTAGYGGCSLLCCVEKKRYALRIACSDKDHSLLVEKKFQSDKDGFYLAGTGVLFILDIILNFQASSVVPLPFILSPSFFFNGIASRPTVQCRAVKSAQAKTYRLVITGWVLSSDILLLNKAADTQASIIPSHSTPTETSSALHRLA